MKVRIRRTDRKSTNREYSIRGTNLALVAMQALERLRKDEFHATSVQIQDDGTASVTAAPARYIVEEIK